MAADGDPKRDEHAVQTWREDVLQTLVQIAGYAKAAAEAQHGQLLALAEIRTALHLQAEDEAGTVQEVTLAAILDAIGDDVAALAPPEDDDDDAVDGG